MKIHFVVNEYGVSINFIVTDGPCADCKENIHLTKNINITLVFTYRDYDTNEILSYLNQQSIKSVIPQKYNRLHQHDYKGFKEKR